jgi:hypothetical protein
LGSSIFCLWYFKAKEEPDTHEDKRADPEAGVLDTRIINIDEDSDP